MIYPLLTPRLSIEPLSESDVQGFVTYRQDPNVARYQSWDVNYSKTQAIALVSSQTGVELPEPGSWLQLAIHKLDSRELVGDLALYALEGQSNHFEIGFTLAPEHQGLGYAREAASRLLEFLFGDIGASKVIAQTDSRNERSISLLLALGFQLIPGKGWQEEFKNEQVQVLFFEKLG